jgi:hypothetical protein
LGALLYNLLTTEKFILTAALGDFPEWHFTAAEYCHRSYGAFGLGVRNPTF